MPKPGLEQYVDSVLLSLLDSKEGIALATGEVFKARLDGARVWTLGNGGSLAIAQHFAQDILKMHGVRAQCLNDASVITAYSNDEGFENSFYGALAKLIDPRDLIFVFSCSGKSPNYKKIFEFPNKKVAVVGTDGGFMKEMADVCIHVQHDDYRVCESAFGIVADLINIGLED